MSSLRNPKTLADWMELDYFRRPRCLKSLWKPVVLTTLVIGVATMVALAVLQKKAAPRLATAYQAGSLSTAHAMFNNDCSQCHVEAFKTWDRLWRFNGSIRAVPDDACQKCHPGPIHHVEQVRNDSCVSCHREHHGHTQLNLVADGDCVQCHKDLRAATRSDFAVHFKDVNSFKGHPDFALRWEGAPKDPGTIAFNHAVHLQPKGIMELDSKQHNELKGTEDRRVLRPPLQCGECHVPDEAGRYMKPISYEQHCKKCHPLTVAVTAPAAGPGVQQARTAFSREPAPHQMPEMVRAALRDRLTQFIKQNSAFLTPDPKAEAVPRPIPGTPARPELVTKQQFEWVGEQLIKVEKPLFNSQWGCAYCHREEDKDKRQEGQLPRFAPSNINERTFPQIGQSPRWFPHSRFNHASHRMLDCQQCHPAATSQKTSEVLMPTIDNCRNCHGTHAGASARSDCVECHTYHPNAGRQQWHGKLLIENIVGPDAGPGRKE